METVQFTSRGNAGCVSATRKQGVVATGDCFYKISFHASMQLLKKLLFHLLCTCAVDSGPGAMALHSEHSYFHTTGISLRFAIMEAHYQIWGENEAQNYNIYLRVLYNRHSWHDWTSSLVFFNFCFRLLSLDEKILVNEYRTFVIS